MQFFEMIFDFFVKFISCSAFLPAFALFFVGLIFIIVRSIINDKY